MATLVLTAVGTLVGGPLGGALGALAGRSIDSAIIGSRTREGPRIKDLAVTTSSYGQPVPRHHGRMRAAGTIIWATDLVEHKGKSGGGKGTPSTTTYSYTMSFAVALSSRSIQGIGRIWADGNLLRGAAGDLKVPGTMRLHTGQGDQQPDPLIAGAVAGGCPAFRGCAYAVFEDLALGDFGNRIPALTFEIIADDGPVALADLTGALGPAAISADTPLAALAGFANEGGPLVSTLETVATLYPLACDAGGERLTLTRADGGAVLPITLPPAARAWQDDDFGTDDGQRRAREAGTDERPDALRYYDIGRDFQPGVQRPSGRAQAGRSRTIEFPGALAADDARMLADGAARRTGWQRDTMQWRMAEMDPAIRPGAVVRVPGRPGLWRVETWEWRERGVELDLLRHAPDTQPCGLGGDTGTVLPPVDLSPGATMLRAFAVPQNGYGAEASPTLFAAAGAREGAWLGAALYLDRAGELVPLGSAGRTAATFGALAAPLAPSPALCFEPGATIDVLIESLGAGFAAITIAGIAQGANRMLVGDEIVQFASATPLGGSAWRLTGLLRGRGGTEPAALAGHGTGAMVILLDDTLIPLDPALVPADPATTVAAIALGDPEPVYAPLANPLLGRRPPSPVHAAAQSLADGGRTLTWIRRARGGWTWPDGVDVPLVETAERYRVGFGPTDAPVAIWETSESRLSLDGQTVANLAAQSPGAMLWVRQLGDYAPSEPTFITRL